MKGNEIVIKTLNGLLASEYAAIQQYEFNRSVSDNMGLTTYSSYLMERVADEMKHAKALRDKILFLEGVPEVEPSQITAIPEVQGQLGADAESETRAIADYESGIRLAVEVGDDATAGVMRANLADEVEHLNDIEARQTQIDLAGFANWIVSQI